MTFFFHQLKNFIQNDPLSDWLTHVHLVFNCFEPDPQTTFQEEIDEKKSLYKKDFFGFLKQYKEHVFYKELTSEQTKEIIDAKEVCVCIQSELYHTDFDILVKPDLIIHRDIFKNIFTEVDDSDLPEYIVIDILYKIVQFNADKTDILNQGSIFYHKCKMLVASQCLNPDQRRGYIFAKEYRHRDKTLRKKECIGIISFTEQMEDTIQGALEWLSRLSKDHHNWIVEPKPSVKELYPNMNCKTGLWTKEKKRIAESIKEITLVWNISYEKRCILLDKGITTWDDPILLHNIYPYEVKESKRELIQEKMIHINTQEELKIQPRRIKNPEFIQHIKNQENSIILDIESVLNLDEKESYFTDDIQANDTPKICIIGTILLNEDMIFKDFTIKYLTNEEEEVIIKYWLNFLKKYFKDTIKIYHWGNAEKVYLEYMMKKYPELKYPKFELVDLVKYFKEEPITIQGCFGYGLKEIVKQLYSFNLIENQWQDDTDGLEAMIQIMKTSEEAEQKRIPLKRFTEIKKIIYYNYMDCRVIIDILELLRTMV